MHKHSYVHLPVHTRTHTRTYGNAHHTPHMYTHYTCTHTTHVHTHHTPVRTVDVVSVPTSVEVVGFRGAWGGRKEEEEVHWDSWWHVSWCSTDRPYSQERHLSVTRPGTVTSPTHRFYDFRPCSGV